MGVTEDFRSLGDFGSLIDRDRLIRQRLDPCVVEVADQSALPAIRCKQPDPIGVVDGKSAQALNEVVSIPQQLLELIERRAQIGRRRGAIPRARQRRRVLRLQIRQPRIEQRPHHRRQLEGIGTVSAVIHRLSQFRKFDLLQRRLTRHDWLLSRVRM